MNISIHKIILFTIIMAMLHRFHFPSSLKDQENIIVTLAKKCILALLWMKPDQFLSSKMVWSGTCPAQYYMFSTRISGGYFRPSKVSFGAILAASNDFLTKQFFKINFLKTFSQLNLIWNCGFSSNWILHFFPLFVCVSVCHRRDISHFSHMGRSPQICTVSYSVTSKNVLLIP